MNETALIVRRQYAGCEYCSLLLSIGTWNVTDSQCTDCVRLQYAGGEYYSLFLS